MTVVLIMKKKDGCQKRILIIQMVLQLKQPEFLNVFFYRDYVESTYVLIESPTLYFAFIFLCKCNHCFKVMHPRSTLTVC